MTVFSDYAKNDISKTCTFTGHKPEKLNISENEVKKYLEENIRKAIQNGYTQFISGMQRGVDIWAAEIVIRLRKEGFPVKLISACAWKGMEFNWNEDIWKKKYQSILEESDEVYYIGKSPGRKSFEKRDIWMVDRSSLLICAFTGCNGGTKHTRDYAVKKGIKITDISIKSNRYEI